MSDFAVSTIFKAKDSVSAVFGKMGKQAGFFGDSADKAFRKASRSGGRFGDIVKGILFTDVLKSGLNQLRQGLSATTSEFISYDKAITSASAKFKGLDLATQDGIDTLEQLKATARGIGAVTEFSATQAAGGLEFLAMAGFNAGQAMAALPGVVDLATAAEVDLARATDIASDALGAFGLMTEDTAQLTMNLARVNDVLAKTTTTANTDMEALFEAVQKGAPAFTAAGQSIETFSTLTGVMANSGVKGSEAGTSLRNVMLRLSDPTAEAAKVMEKLGIEAQDQQGNFRDVIDILGDFETGLDGMGTAQRTAALSTVFGARAVTGINLLLQEGTDGLRTYRESLIDSAGASKTMADVIRGSIGNQLASLQSAAIELGFKFFDAFEGQIGPAITSFTETIRAINVPAVVEGFRSFFNVLSQFKPVIMGIVAGMVAYQAILVAFAVAAKVKAFLGFVAVLKATAAATSLLNVVMAANPIGLVAVAIAALVTGVILLRDNWDAVVAAFKSGFGIFGKIASFFGGDDAVEVERTVNVNTRQAPNAAQLAAQRVQFQGQLNINGAPPGSTATSETTGAPAVRMDLAGRNL